MWHSLPKLCGRKRRTGACGGLFGTGAQGRWTKSNFFFPLSFCVSKDTPATFPPPSNPHSHAAFAASAAVHLLVESEIFLRVCGGRVLQMSDAISVDQGLLLRSRPDAALRARRAQVPQDAWAQ